MSESRRRRRSDAAAQPYEEFIQPETAYAPPRQPDPDPSYTAPRQPEYSQASAPLPPSPAPVFDNRTVIVNQINAGFGDQSYFDGGLLSLIGWSILAGLLILFTLGFGYPFAACMLYSWEARHTVINGRRLRFDGNGWQLIGKWILWMLLTIITLGIYSFWLAIKLKQWRIKHTHFA